MKDTIDRLHSIFKDMQCFEFGEDFIRYYDQDLKVYVELTVKILPVSTEKGQGSTIVNKTGSNKVKTKNKNSWAKIYEASKSKI